MYPGFTEEARADRDGKAVAEFETQEAESREHAEMFRKATHNFGLLTNVENHHARQYTEALETLMVNQPHRRKQMTTQRHKNGFAVNVR
ncbi:MAG: hypothetical protein HC917_21420 [Richelia sp. SM2_1_7]|nr:hypothetical protein [Richelia sp. SM2_1_7]